MKSKLFDFGKIVEGVYYPGTFLIGISKKFFGGMKYACAERICKGVF